MKQRALSALTAFLFCITALAAVVYGVGTSPRLMQSLMLRTAPSETTMFPEEQYGAVTQMMTDYLKGHGDFQLIFQMDGIAYNAFNEREQSHMADVQGLFRLCRILALCGAVLTLICWFFARKQPFFWRTVRRTVCIVLAFVVLIALLAMVDFDRLFILFHQIAFTNNLWLLNPHTDLLIRLMPTQLFIDYALIIGMIWAAMLGILLIIATVKLRNQQ